MGVKAICTYDRPARWPFTLLSDARDRQIGWALINGPIVTPAQQDQFTELRRAGHRFVGASSCLSFPYGCDGDPLDYEAVCEAWCHCFRAPERFFRTAIPRALISVSDFTDHQRVSKIHVSPLAPHDGFDLLYVGTTEEWKRAAKNWSLAARCVPRLCRDLGLRALVIGSPTDEFAPSDQVTFMAPLPWRRLLSYLAHARFLLVPNACDPSPRIIAEALCLDVPILVHRDILGGWKYVNRFTGAFFDDERDVTESARAICAGSLAPRAWFCANHGPYLAGRRLLSLVRSIDPAVPERSHLCLSDGLEEPDPAR